MRLLVIRKLTPFFFISVLSIFSFHSFAFAEWDISTIETEGNIGESASLKVDSRGQPHIAYLDGTASSKVKYGYWTGSTWTATSIDWGLLRTNDSLDFDSFGATYVAYETLGTSFLRYAKCLGTTCETKPTGSFNQISYPSIALDRFDNIHLAFLHYPSSSLKYVKCDGLTYSSPELVDAAEPNISIGGAGFDTSIEINSNGQPCISYREIADSKKTIKFACKIGSSWERETVDPNGGDGGGTSLAFDRNGKPYISYVDSNNNVVVAKKELTWERAVVDYGEQKVSGYSSLAFDSTGILHISYLSNTDLKYAKQTDIGRSTYTVDFEEEVGFGTSIGVDKNNNPMILYRDKTDYDLKFASWSAVSQNQPKPKITSVYPNPVIGSESKQWLTVNGSGFVEGSSVTLTELGNTPYFIKEDHICYSSQNQIRIFVGVGNGRNTWIVTIINPNNLQDSHSFEVVKNTLITKQDLKATNFTIKNPLSDLKTLKVTQCYDCDRCSKKEQKNPYHSGLDIVLSSTVFPVADGFIVMIQENGGNLSTTAADCHPPVNKDDFSNCADRGMGNSVILGHPSSGGIVYSQYSHFASFGDKIKEAMKLSCPEICGQTEIKTHYCSSPIEVKTTDPLGVVGGTGFGTNFYDIHLHLELKNSPTLGANCDGCYGYTKTNPDEFGYFDPAKYFSGYVEYISPCNSNQKLNQNVNETGGTLIYQQINSAIEVKILEGSFSETKVVTVEPITLLPLLPDPQINLKMPFLPIAINITVEGGGQPSKPVTITMTFQDSDVQGLDRSLLAIARLDETSNRWLVLNSVVIGNTIVATTNHFSIFALVQQVPQPDLSKARVYPNPFNLSKNIVTNFNHLPANSTLQIYNIAGERVRELDDNDGDGLVTWDGRNDSGENVASGVYLVMVKGNGSKKTLKVVITK